MKFADLWAAKEPPATTPASVPAAPPDADHARRYALAALARENAALAATTEGSRNHQLNVSTFSVAQLIPHLSETEIRDTLGATARAIGLEDSEIRATLASGIGKGRSLPRIIPAPTGNGSIREVALADLLGEEQRNAVEQFWEARPVLTHIRAFALARMSAPWAVLGGCLLRAVCAMPPHIVLPPTIGGVGSLNLLVGLVGPSGAGKGASEAAAADALTWPDQHTAPLGSGEGVTHAYARPRTRKEIEHSLDGDELHWEHTSVLFSAPEVDQVAAISQRRGSTLMTQLRSAYSGERLGMQYADAAKRIILPAHRYRFGLSVGIQPDRAEAILAEADGGTPQRFLWLPVTDAAITSCPPAEPEPWRWATPLIVDGRPEGSYRDNRGRVHLPIPDQVRTTIREAHAARARGEGDALDGHSLYTRLKVAHALALLDQRAAIDMDDWRLAGTVMAVSDVTRAKVQAKLSARLDAADEARAKRDANRQAITEEAVADRAVKRVAKNLARKVQEAGQISRPDAYRSVASRDREHYEDAVARLVDTGQIAVSDTDQGEVLRWVQ